VLKIEYKSMLGGSRIGGAKSVTVEGKRTNRRKFEGKNKESSNALNIGTVQATGQRRYFKEYLNF